MKQCTKCKETKGFDQFYKKKNGKHGLSAKCKQCVNQQTDAWHKRNPERKKAAVDKWRFGNPEKVRENSKNWDKNNSGRRAAQVRRYQASKLQATPLWLSEEHFKQMQNLYIEAARLTKETGIRYEVDHIAPLQGKNVRGLHVPWNLQILPRSKNRFKSNKMTP